MERDIGAFLQTLRTTRRLSLSEGARRAGIAKSTLSKWEAGRAQPRLPELDAALEALAVNERERRQALQLMNAPRALARLRQETIPLPDLSGAPPCGGDLLRAMRLRRGRTQTEVAAHLGVPQTTVVRWERGESLPSEAQLHAFCFLLDAYPQELAALACHPFLLSLETPDSTPLDTLWARYAELQGHWNEPEQEALKELRLIALEAQTYALAVHSLPARELLVELFTQHAFHLSQHNRFGEAANYTDRVLDILGSDEPTGDCWLKAALISARASVYRRRTPQPAIGLEMLAHWQQWARGPEYCAWVLSDQAHYLAAAGDMEAALTLGEQAYLTAQQSANRMEASLRLCDLAQLRLRAGQREHALDTLPADTWEKSRPSVSVAMRCVDILLAANDLSAAHVGLERIRTFDSRRLLWYRRQIEALHRRLL